MSVEYGAKIMVGLPRSEIINQDLIEDDELEVCPTSYDGDRNPWNIAGLEYARSGDYNNKEITFDDYAVTKLKEKFFELTGQKANVYLSTHGH